MGVFAGWEYVGGVVGEGGGCEDGGGGLRWKGGGAGGRLEW